MASQDKASAFISSKPFVRGSTYFDMENRLIGIKGGASKQRESKGEWQPGQTPKISPDIKRGP